MISFTSQPLIRAVALLAAFALSACGPERVVLLEAKEDELISVNGCVISACNYLALVKTKHSLEKNFWAKILLVRYENHPAGHAYCVWETEGTIYGYDRNSGGFPIPVYTRDARAIAIVLAQDLGRIMKEPLAVRSAEFIEPESAKLYKFSDGKTDSATLPLASVAPFRPTQVTLATREPVAR